METKQEIIAIYIDVWSAQVGKGGITSIKETQVNGHMAKITVFDIYKGDKVYLRIYPNGHHIQYKI